MSADLCALVTTVIIILDFIRPWLNSRNDCKVRVWKPSPDVLPHRSKCGVHAARLLKKRVMFEDAVTRPSPSTYRQSLIPCLQKQDWINTTSTVHTVPVSWFDLKNLKCLLWLVSGHIYHVSHVAGSGLHIGSVAVVFFDAFVDKCWVCDVEKRFSSPWMRKEQKKNCNTEQNVQRVAHICSRPEINTQETLTADEAGGLQL